MAAVNFKEEWREPEEETPIYFLADIFDEVIYYIGLEEARMRLNELTCPASTNDGWIPVEERLPEEKGVYLVTYHPCYWDNVDPEVYVGIDTFRGKTTWAKRKFQRVIAWRPFPEPYQAERSDNNDGE